jgi:hypothetical protein
MHIALDITDADFEVPLATPIEKVDSELGIHWVVIAKVECPIGKGIGGYETGRSQEETEKKSAEEIVIIHDDLP